MADPTILPGTTGDTEATIPVVQPQVSAKPLPPRNTGSSSLSLRVSEATNFRQALGRAFQKHMIRDATASLASIAGSPFTARSVTLLGNDVITTLDREWTKLDFDHFKAKIRPMVEQLQMSMQQYNQMMVPRMGEDGQTYIVGPPGGELPVNDPRSLDFLRQASATVQQTLNQTTSDIMDVASTDFIHNPEVEKFARSLANSYVESINDMSEVRKESMEEQKTWMGLQNAGVESDINKEKLVQAKVESKYADENEGLKGDLSRARIRQADAAAGASNAAAWKSRYGESGGKGKGKNFITTNADGLKLPNIGAIVASVTEDAGFDRQLARVTGSLLLKKTEALTKQQNALETKQKNGKLTKAEEAELAQELTKINNELNVYNTKDAPDSQPFMIALSNKAAKQVVRERVKAIVLTTDLPQLLEERGQKLTDAYIDKIIGDSGFKDLSDVHQTADEWQENARGQGIPVVDASPVSMALEARNIADMVEKNPQYAKARLEQLGLSITIEDLQNKTDAEQARDIMDALNTMSPSDRMNRYLAGNKGAEEDYSNLEKEVNRLKTVINQATKNRNKIPSSSPAGKDRWLATKRKELADAQARLDGRTAELRQ